MGLPAVRITDSMVPKLKSLLLEEGVIIDELKSEVVFRDITSFADGGLLCSDADGGVVHIYFAHAVGDTPDGVIVVFRPASPALWSARATNRLIKRIETVLRKNGATDAVSKKSK